MNTRLVRETGLEPVRDYHTPLKRARLPIPPLSLALFPSTACIIANREKYVKAFWEISFEKSVLSKRRKN